MGNFGIMQAFLTAGVFNKFLLIVLLLMSVYSWSIIFAKYKMLMKHLNILSEINYVADSRSLGRLEGYLITSSGSYVDSINLIVKGARDKKLKKEDLESRVDLVAKSAMAGIENGIDYLATIASVAPFIGLLGTVIGVINSFQQIGLSASASLAVIAPGIAEALYATALGLFVAIPASAFYNMINNKIYEYKEKRDFLFNKIYYFVREE